MFGRIEYPDSPTYEMYGTLHPREAIGRCHGCNGDVYDPDFDDYGHLICEECHEMNEEEKDE